MSLTASSKRGSGANRIDHPFLRNATKKRGSKKTDFKGLEKILIIIIIIIIVVFIRIIIRNCYCSLRVSAKTNQVRQFSDSQHAIQNHRGKSNLGFQIGNRSSCTKLACVCNHLLRLFCVYVQSSIGRKLPHFQESEALVANGNGHPPWQIEHECRKTRALPHIWWRNYSNL